MFIYCIFSHTEKKIKVVNQRLLVTKKIVSKSYGQFFIMHFSDTG